MTRAPRIVLVGGAPGVGKSTLGRNLAHELGATSLTLDDVMVGVRAATTPESHPELHPIRRAGGHLRYFTETSPDELIEDSLALERATWPIVRALVAAHVTDGQRLVLDWWLLRPADVAGLDGADVKSIWIHLDAETLAERERANTGFLAGSADPERMHANFMARSRWRNDLLAVEAAELGLPLLRLDGHEPPQRVVELALATLG